MEHKTIGVNVKAADAGTATAVFSRFNTIDADGDVTEPGAFTPGVVVPISSFNHGSWGSSLPVGKATIRVMPDRAEADMTFFLGTDGGKQTFEVVKQLGPCLQYSYGYDVLDAAPGTWEGRSVRFLRKLKVHEVSPVLVGAGVRTMTVAGSVKGHNDGASADVMAEVRAIGAKFWAAEEQARAEVRRIAENFERTRQLCVIAENLDAHIRKEAALLRYSEAKPPGGGREHAAWAALIACCDELGVDLPMLRWFAPETAQQAAYVKRWGTRDWHGFSTEQPVRGLWDGFGTVWVANNLTHDLTVATVAHEACHAAGGDEAAAQDYEARYAADPRPANWRWS